MQVGLGGGGRESERGGGGGGQVLKHTEKLWEGGGRSSRLGRSCGVGDAGPLRTLFHVSWPTISGRALMYFGYKPRTFASEMITSMGADGVRHGGSVGKTGYFRARHLN